MDDRRADGFYYLALSGMADLFRSFSGKMRGGCKRADPDETVSCEKMASECDSRFRRLKRKGF